ncbi:hypothetical protein BH24BAC1_BH24BAC1_09450 [soil metagenome]
MKKLTAIPVRFRFWSALLVICCALVSVAAIPANEGTGEEVNVKGEVLDMSCFMASGAKGEGHKSCAEKCLSNGMPIGLLGSDGKVYLLVEDHKNAEPYQSLKKQAAAQVSVTGKYFQRNGMPGIVIAKVTPAK